jgi:chromosome segregation ATPase
LELAVGPEHETPEHETIAQRVERMDAHLKQFFDDQQGFISLTVENAEKRLTALVTDSVGGLEKRLTGRLEKFETAVKAGFKTIDDRLSAHDQRFAGIDRRLDGIDRRLDSIDGRLDAIDSQLGAITRDLRTLIGRKTAARQPKRGR